MECKNLKLEKFKDILQTKYMKKYHIKITPYTHNRINYWDIEDTPIIEDSY